MFSVVQVVLVCILVVYYLYRAYLEYPKDVPLNIPLKTKLEKLPSLWQILPMLIVGQYAKYDYNRGRKLLVHSKLPQLSICVDNVRISNAQLLQYLDCLQIKPKKNDHVPFAFFDLLALRLQLYLFGRREFPFRLLGAVHSHTKCRIFNAVPMANIQSLAFDIDCKLVPKWEYSDKNDLQFSAQSTFYLRNIDNNTTTSDVIRVAETVNTFVIRAPDTLRFKVFQNTTENNANSHPSLIDCKDTTTHNEWPKIDSNKSRQFAKISGDYNPIHLYRWTAKLFGMRTNILHGMWSVGRIVNSILSEKRRVDIDGQISGKSVINGVIAANEMWECSECVESEASFVRPLFLPDTPTLYRSTSKSDPRHRYELVTWNKKAEMNKPVIVGSVTIA